MSISRKQLLKSAMLATMSVTLLATAVYFLIPSYLLNPSSNHFIPLAFALGAGSEIPGNNYTVNVQELGLIVKFSNGSSIQIYKTGGISTPEGVIIPDGHVGEINEAGIEEITVYTTAITIIHHYGSRKIILAWVQNMTIDTALVDGETKDLGFSNTIGDKNGVTSSTEIPNGHDYDDLPLDISYPRSTSCSGYWQRTFKWVITASQLKEILANSNSANIVFTLDFSIYLKYKIVTTEGNITGDINLQWSGTWGTLQVSYIGDEIYSVAYNLSNIKLNAVVTNPP